MRRTGFCSGCLETGAIAYVDGIDRGFCADCVVSLPIGSAAWAMGLRSASVPFNVGDRIEVDMADGSGTGTVAEVRFEVDGGGFLAPVFRVVFDDPADGDAPGEGLYAEVCLRKVVGGRND